jgi:hypothetical protein
MGNNDELVMEFVTACMDVADAARNAQAQEAV